jgi:hypothetical protein
MMRLRDELAASKRAEMLRIVCSCERRVSVEGSALLRQRLAYGTLRNGAFNKFARLGVDTNVS